MRFTAAVAVPAWGLVATGGLSASSTSVPSATVAVEKPWKRCWSNYFIADVCCSGAWGGSGCWEEKRSFNQCCRQSSPPPSAPPPKQAESEVFGSDCRERLGHVAAALSPNLVLQHVVEPVETKVHHELGSLSNFTGPYARKDGMLAPYLSGLSPFEREMLLALGGLVGASLEAHDISFWLHGSALLGSLLHFGPEPWAESLSLAAFAPSANDITSALLAGARASKERGNPHGAFGPVMITPSPALASCHGHCGHWVVSFAQGLTYRSSSAEAGPRIPNIEVIWLDPRGQSPGWRRCFGDPMPKKHRELLALALPVVRGRPFANLRLPIPRHAWQMAEVLAGVSSSLSLLEVCHMGSNSLRPPGSPRVAPLPCAALVAMFPMVLLRHAFSSAKELLEELGESAASGAVVPHSSLRTLRRNALAAAGRDGVRPELTLSVEVLADAVRGATVLLVAEEGGGGSAGGPITCHIALGTGSDGNL